ncbi:hypothetical protein TWF481_010345 [Arthrobotrys musiformis]|uniref:Uncharacterized protein n=1 Tax=Arthrobotrys musiformis TaxID=47236 RepID=A0AAV9W2W3_9PEZI
MHVSIFFTAVGFVPAISAHLVFRDVFGDYNSTIKGWSLGDRKGDPSAFTSPYGDREGAAVFSTPAFPTSVDVERDPLVQGCGISLFWISNAELNFPPSAIRSSNDDQKEERYWRYKYPFADSIKNIMLPTGYNGPFIPIAGEINTLIAGGSLPQATKGGSISFKSISLTGQSSGDFACSLSEGGDAMQWNKRLQVAGEPTSGSPVTIDLPKDLNCTGTVGGVEKICVLRCVDSAWDGPFGGCIAFRQMEKAAPPKVVPQKASKATKKPAKVKATNKLRFKRE